MYYMLTSLPDHGTNKNNGDEQNTMGTNNRMGTNKCGHTNERTNEQTNERTKSAGYLIEIRLRLLQVPQVTFETNPGYF